MQHLQPREVSDLHAAALAIGKNDFRFQSIDSFCQILPDLLRDLIFLFFKAERAPHAATVCLDVIDGQAGNPLKDFKGGKSDAQGFEVTRREVSCL